MAILLRDTAVSTAAASAIRAAGLRVVADPDSAQVCLSDQAAVPMGPTVLVVAVTPAASAGALAAVMAGRAGGAATEADMGLLPTLVRSVAGGALAIAPRVAILAQELPVLSPRDLDVLGLVAEGIPLREVGRRLHLSHATVKREIRKLFDAVGARSRVELVLVAKRLGLLERGPSSRLVGPTRSAGPAAGRPPRRHHLSLGQEHHDV